MTLFIRRLLFFLPWLTASMSSPLWKDVCTQDDVLDLPFCNTTLAVEQRVTDLLGRLPVQSQIKMMIHTAAAYEELHIPPYQWWSEGLHGILQYTCFTISNRTACATSFPTPSTLASSMNDTLFYLVASAVGLEGRAVSNIRDHDMSVGDGLTYWTPVVNLQRDPRWGRNQEAPGEDPLLTSRFAVQYVKGLQQIRYDEATPKNPMQVAACCKHFVANSLERWNGYSRHDFDAVISQRDLLEYYYPPFAACVKEAGVAGIMCSYNALNGIPTCVNEPLLREVLRESWEFEGYITSDCGALEDVQKNHNYTNNPVDTVALAANATTNLNCGRLYKDFLPSALEQGKVTNATLNENMRQLLTVQMKLGLYDPKSESPFASLGIQEIDSIQHQELALDAAQQSIVLLQNLRLSDQKPTLPLQRGQRIAVIGPHANATTAFLGNYRGWRCPSGNDQDCVLTPYEAIARANMGGTTISALGTNVAGTLQRIEEAKGVASSADAIVVLVGLDTTQETEELDRINTTLPGFQVALVESILDLNNPLTILVLINGGTISLGPRFLQTPAIVAAGYGGQSAAQAISNVLFGEYNPSARLAATMYPPNYVNEIPLTEMSVRKGIGRTHMFYQGKAEFGFGHGLSYSDWSVSYEYSFDPNPKGDRLKLLATIRNQGPWPGRQSLLLLAVAKDPKPGEARQKLLDYTGTSRVLEAGGSETLSFALEELPSPDVDLVVLEPNGRRVNLGYLGFLGKIGAVQQ